VNSEAYQAIFPRTLAAATSLVGFRVRPYVIPNDWLEASQTLRQASSELTAYALRCYRSPTRLIRGDDFAHLRDRIERCIAFGQALDIPSATRQDAAQFGLYGTSAALELYSSALSPESLNHLDDQETLTHAHDFIRTWNFFDFVVDAASAIESEKFWDQTRTTLRVCQALRALSRTRILLDAFTPTTAKRVAGDALLEDVAFDGGFQWRDRVNQLVGHLSMSIAGTAPAEVVETLGPFASVRSYTYARGSSDAPETAGSWLFMWSAVIATVADLHGVLSSDQLKALCTYNDVNNVKRLLASPEINVDWRFRLYALWSLAYLVRSAPDTWKNDRVPEEVRHMSRTLLRQYAANAASWTDLHSQYQVFFDADGSRAHFRDEYFVIPVVPTAWELAALTSPDMLFTPLCRQLLGDCCDAIGNLVRPIPYSVMPYQVGDRNGTVNSVYYARALRQVASVYAECRWRGMWWSLKGFLGGRGGALKAALVGLSYGVLVLLVTQDPHEALIALIAAIPAAFFYEGLKPWFQRRRL
jgi:hypothetical protein